MDIMIHTADSREILRKARREETFSRDEALAVLDLPNDELSELLDAAGALRKNIKEPW
jgi:biotin synthase-like enzyme